VVAAAGVGVVEGDDTVQDLDLGEVAGADLVVPCLAGADMPETE